MNIYDEEFRKVWRAAEKSHLPVQLDRDVVCSRTWQTEELSQIVNEYDVPATPMHMNELHPSFLLACAGIMQAGCRNDD